MTCSTLLSLPTSAQQSPFSHRRFFCVLKWSHVPTTIRYPSNLISPCSRSPTPLVAEEEGLPPAPVVEDGVSVQPESAAIDNAAIDNDDFLLRGCKACGREEIEKGCNGEGRIQGGIATVPGFGWWPIKAYRPCPGFLASGGRYRRHGQSMDEVAFGRGEREPSIWTNDDEGQSSKKKHGPRKFKR